jgi:hypothetical protein
MGDAASLITLKAKPIIVAVAYPAYGHNSGMIHISSNLVKHGFKVYFVSGSDFEGPIKESGAEYIENTFNFITNIVTTRPSKKLDWVNAKYTVLDVIGTHNS